MKNALLALALFACAATATAHDGEKDGKKGKKETAAKTHCSAAGATAGTPSCCMKKGAATTAQVSEAKPAAAPSAAPAAAPAVKTM